MLWRWQAGGERAGRARHAPTPCPPGHACCCCSSAAPHPTPAPSSSPPARHRNLAPNLAPSIGYNAVDGERKSSPNDAVGHGTEVAGVIAGAGKANGAVGVNQKNVGLCGRAAAGRLWTELAGLCAQCMPARLPCRRACGATCPARLAHALLTALAARARRSTCWPASS